MKLAIASVRAATAFILCLLMVEQPLLAAAPVSPAARLPQIPADERTLHALNRLTFGPRPGDVQAVESMGLKRWFEEQLNPSRIDDAALDARLVNYPAMKLSQQALMQRFPSPLVLRTIEKQNLPLPSDPVQHAIYADQLAFYVMKQQAKAAKTPDAAAGDQAAAKPAQAMDDVDMASPVALAAHEDKLYSGLEAIKIINLPPDQRMHRLLSMSPKELLDFRRSLSQRELAEAAEGLSPQQKEILVALSGSGKLVGGEVLQTRLLRDIYSNRQLEAVMTDFWLNHFNIYLRKNQNEPYLLPAFERDVIRPNALGKFEDLLVATAESPAMLMYLDNWQSIGPESEASRRGAQRQQRNPSAKFKPANGLNENYARELMELHTLGVGGGYTQADVTQVAKVFTGWTIEKPYRGASFLFDSSRHEPGPKQVLGSTIRDGGEKEGLQVLHMLATSPATATFISTKLAVRFVSDEPPPAMVERMAKSFVSSSGDIKTVLRTMFDSPEFWTPEVYRAKVKTPLEFVVSAARASNAEITNPQPLVQSLDKLGMPLYGMQTPNGYSWKAEPWVSTGALVSRMNFALVLTGDRLQGVRSGLPQLLSQPVTASVQPVSLPESSVPQDVAARERHLEQLLLGQPVSERTRQTVLKQFADSTAHQQAEKDFPIRATDPVQMSEALPGGRLDAPPANSPRPATPEDRQTATMAGLLLGSPEFQRR